ncbi:MAG: hypothetical protein J6S14_21630 [Clostridia bacterium]|nr:hypothetical protein [Clostridia bacterium]
MITENALHVLFRRIQPETVIKHWLTSSVENQPLSIKPHRLTFNTALQNDFNHYSALEADYVYEFFNKNQEFHDIMMDNQSYGVFGIVANAVDDYLILDCREECLCKYKYLLRFRELTHTIDPMIFIAAFLAMSDKKRGKNSREVFSWPLVVRTDNVRLHHILDKGIAENHFHIGGSVDSFAFSWICLMNHYSANRKVDFDNLGIDSDPLDTIRLDSSEPPQSSYVLTFKAACIRYYLYCKLTGIWKDDNTISDYRNWLRERLLVTSDEECHQYATDLEQRAYALATECVSEFKDGFVPDYAIRNEPLPPMDDDDYFNYSSIAIRNYERRLYRPLSGEQRFLYHLFRAVFTFDPLISEDLDLAYAYLLIYCRIRGELVQVNRRVGFSNFSKYETRKDILFKNPQLSDYDALRIKIAEQVVLANPQIVSFEGRLSPGNNADAMIEKIERMYNYASQSNFITHSKLDELLAARIEQNAAQKMHYVIHFPKKNQPISDNEYLENTKPRNYIKREDVKTKATAVIDAMERRSDLFARVTGIDACAEEIDCRPEVFACQFRRIKQHCSKNDAASLKLPLPRHRITFHVGEDFLDPIDGLRAINEAIHFCEMTGGDRLGHALALGIDCEEWYIDKERHVLLRKQALLDNLVWLYGQMHQYNIDNQKAEDHIQKYFKKYFTEIYTRNAPIENSLLYSVDLMDYYASLGLRGNDPYLYSQNPELQKDGHAELRQRLKEARALEPWRIRKGTDNYDELSNVLYHYYHFNFDMKKKSDEIVEHRVPRCIISVVCALQEKMRYDISRRNIGVECNPSSNYLIGTFKDYLKHPIFKFNNKHLFPNYDLRSSIKNPYILASINTDDLGVFCTSLENEYALVACALEEHNEYCDEEQVIPPDNIYAWLDNIRLNGLNQSFRHVNYPTC